MTGSGIGSGGEEEATSVGRRRVGQTKFKRTRVARRVLTGERNEGD